MSGTLSPEQFQQLMYMQALSQGNQGGGNAPTSSGMGALGQGVSNAVSPIMRMLMMRSMMPQGQGGGQTPQQMPGFAPAMTPGQQGTGGFVAPYGPGAIGGGNPMMSPMALAPQPSGMVAPPLPGGGIGGSAPLANTSGLPPGFGSVPGVY